MKTVVISECGDKHVPGSRIYDLNDLDVKDCIGCWTCWWKTPGRCLYRDLNEFYHDYVTADKAIYFARISKGFVSGKMKTLFDRMIPLYLPYTTYETGESMHVPRYERYPDIEFYYEGEFDTPEAKNIFEEYIQRVFYQFYSKLIFIKPLGSFRAEGGRS